MIVYKFDPNKDNWNYFRIANTDSPWNNAKRNLPEKLKNKIAGKPKDESMPTIEAFTRQMHKSPFIPLAAKTFSEAWQKIETKYFSRLEQITGNPFPHKEMTAYLTTAPSCPYDLGEKWFMVQFFASIPTALQISAHELLHFHFHHYDWPKAEKQIGNEKTADLKESLTVLLNLEFQDLWFVPDRGYEPHQKLRSHLTEQWQTHKNYQQLIQDGINYLK